ncbi:hypothetical protein Nepgr_017979 [Nepenthes gracilis]|uniref:Uncharacterized protein n=1 Tax=Nepenthes gracilis TaxID=150966 RepID=A0AAD3XT16_NEPGR|nr:hypothetical protein Nepgr_017979 [Nepenthes gracilis]
MLGTPVLLSHVPDLGSLTINVTWRMEECSGALFDIEAAIGLSPLAPSEAKGSEVGVAKGSEVGVGNPPVPKMRLPYNAAHGSLRSPEKSENLRPKTPRNPPAHRIYARWAGIEREVAAGIVAVLSLHLASRCPGGTWCFLLTRSERLQSFILWRIPLTEVNEPLLEAAACIAEPALGALLLLMFVQLSKIAL